ncbi:hypothetical protein EWB00_001837 [Schistosoma japonicum]|uniref:RPA-interacting protein C-terminal domain-containing protein n=1 Tax=Schistosoma japonicum TaxID=6182 RepID=A0A4Z2DE28_SCHJA|nr:hypothetical protein EWB00_001837 [Schistosoma japonicum]
MNKHKELYAKHFQHKEEKWKDLLHKRFMESMQLKRAHFIDHLRNIHNSEPKNLTDEILLKEKRELLKSLVEGSEVEQLDLDSLISLQDRILNELSIEIEEYLNPEFRNSRNNNTVNPFYSADETHIETVLCPLCQNGRLSLDSTILTCSSCHLHLDTQTDSLNLTTIGNSLLDAQTKHQTSGCPYALHAWLIDQNANSQSFVQNNIDENGNLYKSSTDIVTLLCIGCDQCSFMEVVV